MEYDNNQFDIDNMNIEEQIDNVEEQENEIINEENNKEVEQDAINFKKNRMVLNSKNLINDLSIKCEANRNIYMFKNDNIEYIGYVVHKISKTIFIFNVKEVKNAKSDYKLKKFDINSIKQIIK